MGFGVAVLIIAGIGEGFDGGDLRGKTDGPRRHRTGEFADRLVVGDKVTGAKSA